MLGELPERGRSGRQVGADAWRSGGGGEEGSGRSPNTWLWTSFRALADSGALSALGPIYMPAQLIVVACGPRMAHLGPDA